MVSKQLASNGHGARGARAVHATYLPGVVCCMHAGLRLPVLKARRHMHCGLEEGKERAPCPAAAAATSDRVGWRCGTLYLCPGAHRRALWAVWRGGRASQETGRKEEKNACPGGQRSSGKHVAVSVCANNQRIMSRRGSQQILRDAAKVPKSFCAHVARGIQSRAGTLSGPRVWWAEP